MLLIMVYYLLQYVGLAQIKSEAVLSSFPLQKDLFVAVFCVFMLIEGVLSLCCRREAKEKSEADKPDNTLNELRQERDSFKTAFAEAQERLRHAEASLQARERPQTVDAELVNLLSLLQEKGRLVDFLMDDIASYSDAQVGAAARVIHQGCSTALREYFSISPVFTGKEGEQTELPQHFDAKSYRLIGSVKDSVKEGASYNGTVVHRGWKTSAVNMPRLAAQDVQNPPWIIAPVEIEL